MPTDLRRRRLMAGSETVVYVNLMLRPKAKARHATWVIVTPHGPMYGTLASV